MANTTNLLDLIRAFEESLHRPEIRGSRTSVENLLAEGFVEFGSSGTVYHRDEIVDRLARETGGDGSDELRAFDYRLTELADGIVLLTYRTRRRLPEGTERHVLRSSVWKVVGGRWKMVFHQGTPTADR